MQTSFLDRNAVIQTRWIFEVFRRYTGKKNKKQIKFFFFFFFLLDFVRTRGCFVAAELNHYSRQALCLTPTLSKQPLRHDWALCAQTCGISSPSVLHAEIPPLLWKQWGWNALSETVNIAAAFKLAYIVYVSSSPVYLLPSAGCVSWNVQRCSCRSAGGCWL